MLLLAGIHIQKCGGFIDTERNFLAASPDGICSKSEFLIEFKCPYKATKVEHLNYIKNSKLNPNHNYYYQVQFQLHVTKILKCHFVVYSSTAYFLHIETISYDVNFVNDCLNHVDFYYYNIFCPEYLKYKWQK